VRVIAATNGGFRKSGGRGEVPARPILPIEHYSPCLAPLRDRPEDIPLLARHFLGKYAFELKKETMNFTDEAMQKLLAYDWPGNVRELENVIERAVVFSTRISIQKVDISVPHSESPHQEPFKMAKARNIEEFERNILEGLLLANQGNISRAARAAEKNGAPFGADSKHKIHIPEMKSNI